MSYASDALLKEAVGKIAVLEQKTAALEKMVMALNAKVEASGTLRSNRRQTETERI